MILAILGRYLYQVYGLDERLFIAAAKGNTARVKALISAAGQVLTPDWEDFTT